MSEQLSKERNGVRHTRASIEKFAAHMMENPQDTYVKLKEDLRLSPVTIAKIKTARHPLLSRKTKSALTAVFGARRGRGRPRRAVAEKPPQENDHRDDSLSVAVSLLRGVMFERCITEVRVPATGDVTITRTEKVGFK